MNPVEAVCSVLGNLSFCLGFLFTSLLFLLMDFEEDSSKFTKKLLVLLSSGFAAYKVVRALAFLPNMVSLTCDIITIFSRDFKHLFTSDSDQIPISLKQLSKIARSELLLEYLTDFTDEISYQFTRAVIRSYRDLTGIEKVNFVRYVSRNLDKLFSTVGTGFFSVIVANFAKKLASGCFPVSDSELTVPSNEKFKKALQHCFIVFLSSPLHRNNANACNHIFSVFTNPAHQDKVIDMLVSLCNRAIDTLAETSHHPVLVAGLTSNVSPVSPGNEQASPRSGGVVTFETTRSGVEFLLWKLMEGLKISLDVVDDEVVCRGLELIRYFIAKSSVFLAIFIAVYLRVLAMRGVVRLPYKHTLTSPLQPL